MIGASLFYDLLCVGQVHFRPGLPQIKKSRLGWVVSGGCSRSVIPNESTKPDRFEVLLRRFWKVWGCAEPIVRATKEELYSEAHFVKNFARLPAGECYVRLPPRLSLDLFGSPTRKLWKDSYLLIEN